MENELILKINKFGNRLKERNNTEVYPISNALRHELRELKKKKLGELKTQVTILKKLKYDEFCETNNQLLEKERDTWHNKIQTIKKDFTKKVEELQRWKDETNDILKEARETDMVDLKIDYLMERILPMSFNDLMKSFSISLKQDKLTENIMKEKFEQKYGEPFKHTYDRIEDIETKFEEAILFGDLELVKEIYFMLKKADSFLDKISNLEMK